MISFSCKALESVWSDIEPFLDLQTTIASSQTSHALYRAIIDAQTEKVKVSQFEVSENRWIVTGKAPACIAHYLPLALNCIHFPSLKRLHLEFPPTKARNELDDEFVDDASTSCFPIFVANLAYAHNLECLHLNAGNIMED